MTAPALELSPQTTTLTSPVSGGGLVAAIAAVMAEVHTVAKNGVNEFHNYRYATMGDILKEITPLLGRHGLVIFQSETGRAMFDDDNVIAVEYAFTVAHVSGETWPPLRQTGVSACRNTKGGWDDKALNKCHTAARKYFLLALFQIPTGEEADADQGESDSQKQSVARSATNRPRISERAIAARVSQSWQGQHTEPFVASEAGMASTNQDGMPSRPDADIEASRAAVQLRNALPQPTYVIEPPKRKLDRMLDKQRDTGPNWEAKIKAEQRRDGRFRQPLPVINERNPPDDYREGGPGVQAAKQAMRSGDDGIPEFLDRRSR
jgi:ERF superfamily